MIPLLPLVLSVLLAGQNPAKENQKPSNPERSKTDTANQNSAKTPLLHEDQLAKPPQKSQQPCESNEASDDKAMSRWFKAQVIIAGIGVLISAVYVAVTFFMLRAIKRQAQLAEQAAKAAERSADAAHDTVATLKASESAFITSENWNLEDFSWAEAGQGSMDLVNAGSTAARIIRVILKYEIVERLPETPNYTGDFPTSPTLFIAGKGKFKLKFPLDPTKIEKELLNAVLAGEKFIYFYGLADYETLFREAYTVGFVAQYHYPTQQFTLPTAPNYTYHRRKTE